MDGIGSKDVAVAALKIAISKDREEERNLKLSTNSQV